MSTASPSSGPPARRTYVIDTSVLLSDPHALRRFAEHDVILPIVVITELEAKRHHAELGYFARTALRHLDDLRLDVRTARRAGAGERRRRHRARRAEPRRPVLGTAGRLPARRQRLPDPGRGVELRRRGPPRHPGLQGSAHAGQGLGRRPGRGGVPRRAGGRVGLDGHARTRGDQRPDRRAVRVRRLGPGRRPRPALPHRSGPARGQQHRAGPGHAQQGTAVWSRRTGTHSGSTAARPSSGWRWISCSTPASASCPSAVAPAPASRPWRSAPVSSRCWSAASTPRWWSSGRCTRSAARNSATCPAPRARRWRPGRRPCSTPWVR